MNCPDCNTPLPYNVDECPSCGIRLPMRPTGGSPVKVGYIIAFIAAVMFFIYIVMLLETSGIGWGPPY